MMRGVGGEPVDVTLRFGSQAGRWVVEEFWHASQRFELLENQEVLFYVHIAVTPEFVNWVLYYGDQVRVDEPAWLRQRVSEAHRRAMQANEEAVDDG